MPTSAYVQSIAFLVLSAVALFLAAGTLAIVGFWVYLAILAGVTVASLTLLDPDLLRERMRPGGQRTPLGLQIATGVMFVHLIIAGIDRGRTHWSHVPTWLQAIGLAAVAAAFVLTFWAMRENRFFSSIARIQADRGQYVVTTGPYAWIRHPGYLAGIVVILANGIALGSWPAAALLIITGMPFLLHRAVTEDRLLQAELPGYGDYASRVRWRIIPGIW